MKVPGRIGVSALIILFLAVGLCYGQSAAMQHLIKGVDYAAQGKFEEAKEEFGKVSKADPLYESAQEDLKVIEDVIDKKIKSKTAIHLYKGVTYVHKRQYDEAISDYTKAIEINPRYVDAYDNRGFIYMVRLEDKKKACADWKRACELGSCRNYEIARRSGDCE